MPKATDGKILRKQLLTINSDEFITGISFTFEIHFYDLLKFFCPKATMKRAIGRNEFKKMYSYAWENQGRNKKVFRQK